MFTSLQHLRFFTVFVFLVFAAASVGCRKCEPQQSPLPEWLKAWVPYSANNQIVFQNDNLQTDTLRVTAWTNENVQEGSVECSNIAEERRVQLSFGNQSTPVELRLVRESMKITYGAGGATFMPMSTSFIYGSGPNTTAAYLPSDVINDTLYNDVLYFSTADNPVKIIRFVRGHGVVQFVDANNVVWNKQ